MLTNAPIEKYASHLFRTRAKIRTTLAVLLLSLHSFAQNTANNYSKEAVDAALERQKHNYEMDMYERYTSPKYKPYIGLNAAFMRFYGDVMPSKKNVTDLGTMWGLTVSMPTNDSENWFINLSSFFGELHSYHTDFTKPVDNLNFLTRVTQLNLSATYQYEELCETFRPYVSAGIGVLSFNPTGDLKDASNSYYPHTFTPTYEYDEIYETNLRRKNLYGDGRYKRTTLVIPAEVGVSFNVGKCLNVRFAYLFNYTFTDFLDNVSGKTMSKAQELIPHENAENYLTADYANFHSNSSTLGSYEKTTVRAAALHANERNDMYGGLRVSVQLRLFTSTKKIHDNVVRLQSAQRGDDAELYKKVMLDDSEAPKSRFTSSAEDTAPKSRFTATEESTLRKRRIPGKFKFVDSNGDGMVSSVEINVAVEEYIDGKSPLTKADIIALQEFYRSQRR
ncbi:MAG: porin family protein [Prevotellaceae bacterium]|jgi:hypothetical protein|nr:porin family protein [Prevotellaceae bacterium]